MLKSDTTVSSSSSTSTDCILSFGFFLVGCCFSSIGPNFGMSAPPLSSNAPKCPAASVSDDSDGEISDSSAMSSVVLSEKNSDGHGSSTTASADVSSKKTKVGFQTLKERARIPPGIYFSTFLVVSLFYSSGIITKSMSDVVPGVQKSIEYVMGDVKRRMTLLLLSFTSGGLESCNTVNQCFSITTDSKGWIFKSISHILVAAVIGSIYYLLVVKPFRAGMWTGARAQRHRVHRYMGLLFLFEVLLV